ncbi:MAG TPA: ester cyclase [Gemmatimonadales bacterium]|nr:ester cyclase [Gemmatimonadales bacterium]
MNAMNIAGRYVAAWNARDTARLAESFREGGTYEDPNTGGPIGTEGLSAYAAALFAAFPDLVFEDAGMRPVSENEVQFAWIMKGTNRGSLRGLPPTGASIALPGLDLIKVCDEGVEQVRGYFDRQTLMEQLGLQVAVQPFSVGPIRFGVCTQVRSESRRPPGAVVLTMIEARSDAEVQQIRDVSRRIMLQLPGMAGFLSFQGAVVGRRLSTVTLWETAESARQVMKESNHKQASSDMFGGSVGAAFHGSTWVLERLGELWVRCRECGALRDAKVDERCRCGVQPQEEPVAFW